MDLSRVTVDLSGLQELARTHLPQPEQVNYEVARDAIRHICYSFDEDSGLYLDEEYARTTRWGGIIAPPGYLYSHGNTFHAWPMQVAKIVDSEGFELDKGDNMGDEWEHFLPVRPGDTILADAQALEPELKHSKQLGVFVLTRCEARLTNQRGELVAIMRGASAKWSGARQATRGRLAPTYRSPAAVPDPGARAGKRASKQARRRFDRHEVFIEDVRVGTEIPELQIGPLTTGHTRLWEAHVWDTSRAEDGGGLVGPGHVPDFYAAGVMRIPWLGSMLTRWAGPNCWVRRLGFRNKEWALVGYAYYCRGSVTRVFAEDGRHYVECALRVENQLGTVTNTGTAVVELRSRAG